MYFHAEVFDGGPKALDDDWRLVVRVLSLGLGVDSDKVKVFPHPFDELVQVPAQIASNRNVMVDLIENVQLIEGDRIDLIERIQAGNVLSVALNDINDVVFSCVALDEDISIVDFVLFQDGLDGLIVHSAGLHHS